VLDEFSDRLGRGEKPDFPESLVLPHLDNTWHDTAEAVVGNWIGCVYQVTHSDRMRPFMDSIDPENPLGLYGNNG
jgi:homoserine O-succinyltransferase